MLLAQLASAWIAQITGTTLKLLAAAFAKGATEQELREILEDSERAHSIALTEITRVMAEAARRAYEARGITLIRWVTEGSNPCSLCIANEDAGPWPLGVPFPSGATSPPQHPRCWCAIVPA